MDITLLYFRQELIDELIKRKYKVYVSFPKSKNVEVFEKKGCMFIDTPMDRHGINPFKDIKIIFKYLKIIKEIKPDYVLTYTIKPNIYGGIACRIRKTKQIANITGLGTAMENKGILQKIAILLHKIGLKKVKCCFVQNTENLEFLKKHKIAKNKLKLIPGSGVNLDKFKLLDYPKESEPIEFLFISRIMKEKGIDQYLETAEYIKSKYNNTKFHILGFCEQEYNEKLNELQHKNIIEYHGRQDNITPFMQKASCVIHPTYYPEGMSNVLLEACASGRPIITTNRAGCREIVDDDVNGYVIKEKDSKDLIEKVEKFINLSNEEKKQMGLAGRRKVEKEFDRNIVVQAYMNEIRQPIDNCIRVLQVLGGLNRGGAETMVMNLYRNIDRNKIQFDFIKHTESKCAYDDEIKELGGRIYSIPKYKVYNHFQYKKAWSNFFKKHPEYKIIHGHVRSTATIYLKIAKKYGLYTIAHSHSTSSGKGIKAIIKSILQFRIRYIADYFMGCSQKANEWLFGKKIANSGRSFVLPNAIDVDKYKYNKEIAKKIKTEFNIENDEMVIGNVGRFSYMKNHKFLIEIFEKLNEKVRCKLLLIGDGELKHNIQEMVVRKNLQNKVIFTGVRNDVNDILQAIDIFLMPSIFEGLPVTLVEAQAAGVPCLISDNITNEVNLTDLIYRESLKADAETWENRIRKIELTKNRQNHIYSDSIKSKGYNIEEEAMRITEFYQMNCEKVKI